MNIIKSFDIYIDSINLTLYYKRKRTYCKHCKYYISKNCTASIDESKKNRLCFKAYKKYALIKEGMYGTQTKK